MKFKFIYLLFFSFLLLIFSCNQYGMIAAISPMEGTMDDLFNDKEAEIKKAYFDHKDRIDLIIHFNYTDGKEIKFTKGHYSIDSNYNFVANLGESVKENSILWRNIIDSLGIEDYSSILVYEYDYVRLKLKMTGYLNPYQKYGKGDYKMECLVGKKDGTVIRKIIKDDWILHGE